ncbi:hypothetical protein Tco_1198775 [Tanacetum coccineum]
MCVLQKDDKMGWGVGAAAAVKMEVDGGCDMIWWLDDGEIMEKGYVAHKTNVAQQFTPQMHYILPHRGQFILGPAPAIYASQPTTLPSEFNIMPPQDPTWHMDTGASSHLNFNASNLRTIFDKRLFSSVHVGDG